MHRYYDAVDWIADGVTVVLIVAIVLLVLREWRTANWLASEQLAAAKRQVDATVQQADSIDRLAAAIREFANSRGGGGRA